MAYDTRFKQQLMGYLASVGASSLRVSKEQEMKLREWIVPYLNDDFGLNGGPIAIEEVRKFVDQWEHADLKEGDYKHYYVHKNTTGKEKFWDWNNPITVILVLGALALLWRLFF